MAKVYREVIKERRFDLEFSQSKLAEFSGVSIEVIKNIETGRSNSTKGNLKKIADALDINLSLIYDPEFRETEVFVFGTNKGGAGKTSISTNIAYTMAAMGKRILLIDADMQMNASDSYGFSADIEHSLWHAIVSQSSLLNYIQSTDYDNLDIIISDFMLARVDKKIYEMNDRIGAIKRILEPVIASGRYDYIIFDTCTNLGDLNTAVYSASDHLVVPLEPTRFGMMGLNIISTFVEEDIRPSNPDFNILGIVLNKINRSTTLSKLVVEQVETELGGTHFSTKLMQDANVANAQWVSTLTEEYDKNSKLVPQLKDLCDEIINRIKIAK